MKFDIVIIGGGASGLCTAIQAKNSNNSVLVLERNGDVGKKILSTGNGKCNLTNFYCKPKFFNDNPEHLYPYFSSGGIDFVEKVISCFDCDSTVNFFNELGVLTENKNGYYYPRSEQAATIRNVLIAQCDSKGIKTICNQEIESISINNENKYRFCINNEIFCKKLVLACGGMSASKTGSDGSGFKLAQTLGHTIIKPLPALCAIKCSEKYLKQLAGVRNDSVVYLYDSNNNLILTSHGNVQFTSYGISGIPVFQISGIAAKLIDSKEKIHISIDLLPEFEKAELVKFIKQLDKEKFKLSSILNSKLAAVIEKSISAKINFDDDSFIDTLADKIKNLKFTPYAVNSFDDSQVTQGGVSTDEINPETMESNIVSGLYFVGEIIDVNGICGGYNLQWAWSTAYIAAKNL